MVNLSWKIIFPWLWQPCLLHLYGTFIIFILCSSLETWQHCLYITFSFNLDILVKGQINIRQNYVNKEITVRSSGELNFIVYQL